MSRVLIITYYWPPSGGSAVLRWLKFTKYLPEFNWEPVIYTPLNPEPQEFDASLMQDINENLEVIKSRIWEPYSIYKWITGRKRSEKLGVGLMSQTKNQGLMSKISLWIRSNFFIPDPRIFWVRPSVKLLTKYLINNPVNVIITTGPPHSMHLIGYRLKRRLNVRWLADFRDPWTRIDFYADLKLSSWADMKHKKLEKKVLAQADHVVAVSPSMTADFQAIGIHKISTITNGYDDVPGTFPGNPEISFTLMHLGSMPSTRNPHNLWEVLSVLIKENALIADKLKVILSGKADYKVIESIRQYGLDGHVTYQAYIPHFKAMEQIRKAQVLLLVINNSINARGILTNKFFEYLSAERPILAIGPEDGDVAAVLSETGAGKIFAFQETKMLKQHLLELFDSFTRNNLKNTGVGIEKYHRRNLTGKLSQLLNKLVS